MPTKYYHAEAANRRGLRFDIYATHGTPVGILQTDDESEQARLDELVADPKSAITALTAEEYAACAKKNPTVLAGLPSPLPTPPGAADTIKVAPGAAPAGPAEIEVSAEVVGEEPPFVTGPVELPGPETNATPRRRGRQPKVQPEEPDV